ncbi:EF-hand domain-containing family member B-like [Leguminivora glycinivorella]|uniref:EF-hand domain-containing family member B-like n=1 Tax=Leguminivora glycinivorella TaxID=1035111 RepID=UPI002010AAE7|nr:EF-hand domain-containing family member B-like [Leguminivora glycinivorella]
MPVDCQRSTSGGKGNLGMFIERTPHVCAAGLPSAEPDDKIKDFMQHYLLKEEADALISDAIHPPKPSRPLPPLRKPFPQDKRNAGFFTEVKEVMFSKKETKFQTIAEDLKNTVYASVWKKPLGECRDSLPMMPAGFDKNTTFGKKTDRPVSLYDIIMPKVPLLDKTPPFKQAGVQRKRSYCEPFNPDAFFGHKSGLCKTGKFAKKCMTDDNVENGITAAVVTSNHANYLNTTHQRLGKALTPYDNIKERPEGSSFGAPSETPKPSVESYTSCKLYPEKEFIKKCFTHLNSVRKVLSKQFLPEFFAKFYLLFKHLDTEKSGWLSKNIVYEQCIIKRIKFDSFIFETLLSLWKAFDGSRIEYKTFVHMINYREPTQEIPKIPDIQENCLNYQTTYMELSEPKCPDVSPMAGIPSGRYFDRDYPITPDNCCKADRSLLPHESDAKSCLYPSVFTKFNVSHRDMYAKREPGLIRKVFENSGERFTDDSFEEIWQEAKKYHSEGWVCFETFKRALIKYQGSK